MDSTCYSELFKMVGKRTKCILLKFIFMSLTLFLFKDYLMSNFMKNILKSFEKQVPKKIPQRKSKRAKELEAKFPVDIFVNKSRKLNVSTGKKFLNRWKYRRDAHRNRVHHIKNISTSCLVSLDLMLVLLHCLYLKCCLGRGAEDE